MKSDDLKGLMHKNAAEITRLQSRVHETSKERDRSPELFSKWRDAIADFSRRYDTLAFPDGYDGVLDRIASGDPATLEAAICFLECRPYFIRSGYMFNNILRRCRRAPLSKDLAERLERVMAKRIGWKNTR